ncbi:unnamed protein product [Symbiodinium necroappetens]|uniref:PDZ domain-containing protein n=1 Tax=Symbiodinium necroappetens TaxID=1628268 RepID=A0A812UGX5_9DINO|nr:unnamed protein product [Symbiodinium necroappetens]
MSSCRGWLGQNSAVNRLARTVCCSRSGPGQQAAYDALEAPGDESDEEPMRHNIAAYPWFLEEDRFQGPPKLVVVLEKAALERSRELIGSRAIAPRPDHPLQITFDALETLLTGEVNQAGRLVVFLHSAQDVYVEVHPGLCLPMSLQSFAKMVAKVLKRRRYTGSSWEAPAVLRVIDGPLRDHLPNDCPWYALSPQGESIQLKDFVRDMVLDSPSGLSCLPGSSGEPAEVALPRAIVFSVGASTGDAMRDMGLGTVVPAVVALSVTAVRGFQDDVPGAHGGTGFVVDEKKGLILTNRHVCTCGPQRATAAFVGCPAAEEVEVSIAYVDPIHDFALLRFDPLGLKNTRLCQIQLDPYGCKVGEDIRVVGNDNLEKLQILAGTIARVDRNAPELSGDFNDENTFYAMAASGTRGGSSGSPVLNKQGKAIALNAAATNGTMHGFYLPLHRVVRALQLIQADAPVTRGTICTSFKYISFTEAERLGVESAFLQSIIEGDASYGATFSESCRPGGVLQVRSVVPGTQAAHVLCEGDVLMEIGGKPVVDFVVLDDAMDKAVGNCLPITIYRNGKLHELECQVQDLHVLIPHRFLEIGFGIFHEVPYQTAQKRNVILSGVYVATAGAVLGQALKSDTIISEVNGQPTPDLASLEAAIMQISDQQYFQVTFTTPGTSSQRRCRAFVKMQHHWGLMRTWTLAENRTWLPCQAATLRESPSVKKRKRRSSASGSSTSSSSKRPSSKAALAGSLCTVTFRTLVQFDLDVSAGSDSPSECGDMICCRGAGIVLDADAGLILTDRATVPQPLGDIEVIFEDEMHSASALFLHPIHSMVVLRIVGAAPSPSAVFADMPLTNGQECDLVGLDAQGRQVSAKVHVEEMRSVQVPHAPGRWHETNIEGAVIHDAPGDVTSGVLSVGNKICAIYTNAAHHEDGEVVRFSYGLPVHRFFPILKQLAPKTGCPKQPAVASLEVQLKPVSLANLRRLPAELRPSFEWLSKLGGESKNDKKAKQAKRSGIGGAVLIDSITAGGPCHPLAQEGDVLAAVGGHVVRSAEEVETRLEALKEMALKGRPSRKSIEVHVVLLRRNEEIRANVTVPFLGSDGARRILGWNGLIVQETPRSMKEAGPVPAGLCISQTLLGSPAEASAIEGNFILGVDGIPTPNLESLLRVGQCRKHLRVETADIHGRRFLKALMPDPLYWPLFEMNQDESLTCIGMHAVCPKAGSTSLKPMSVSLLQWAGTLPLLSSD